MNVSHTRIIKFNCISLIRKQTQIGSIVLLLYHKTKNRKNLGANTLRRLSIHENISKKKVREKNCSVDLRLGEDRLLLKKRSW